ncbi:hypothetical protein ACHHRT_12045 [Desulfurivibrio sp. D14AmB]|uniref:hypothetical protein n=1 Tax=Desulfurivibrio sp. D14AmB TaxID=3374370 RepID=UPI00376EEFCB
MSHISPRQQGFFAILNSAAFIVGKNVTIGVPGNPIKILNEWAGENLTSDQGLDLLQWQLTASNYYVELTCN